MLYTSSKDVYFMLAGAPSERWRCGGTMWRCSVEVRFQGSGSRKPHIRSCTCWKHKELSLTVTFWHSHHPKPLWLLWPRDDLGLVHRRIGPVSALTTMQTVHCSGGRSERHRPMGHNRKAQVIESNYIYDFYMRGKVDKYFCPVSLMLNASIWTVIWQY